MTDTPLKTWLVSIDVRASHSTLVRAATEENAIAIGQALFETHKDVEFIEDNNSEEWHAECQDEGGSS